MSMEKSWAHGDTIQADLQNFHVCGFMDDQTLRVEVRPPAEAHVEQRGEGCGALL